MLRTRSNALRAFLLALVLSAPGAQAQTIGVLGDSITEGRHTTPIDPTGYFFLLRERLPEYEWFNLGCDGAGTGTWEPPPSTVIRICQPLDPDLTPPPPSFVGNPWNMVPWSGAPARFGLLMIFLGNNDPWSFTPAEFRTRLLAIIGHVFDSGLAARVYLVRPPLNGAHPEWDARIAAYGNAIAAIAGGDPDIHAGPDLTQAMDPQLSADSFEHTELADLLEASIPVIFAREIPGPGPWLGWAMGLTGAGVLWRRRRRAAAVAGRT